MELHKAIKKKVELLSPAGGMEQLIAAVQNGADAVYFGGGSFNARRYAANFAGDELTKAVDYCHERGIRAYITLNTLVFDRELPAALDFAESLYRIRADAVLVQDIGLAAAIRRTIPELTLHASTQMGIHDEGGLKYCAEMGITRAVLARETSLQRIKYLAEHSSVELEIFAHGALCMSFSGSCLYSSMSGERSGNRGTCAQPCRKRASVSGRPDTNDFCLSPNDICTLEHINAFRDAGVACIKIEGRMKKPEYVAAVTRAYRAALDGADAKSIARLKAELFELFNRGDFNTAHLFSDSVRTDRVASSKPGKQLLNAVRSGASGENRKQNVKMSLELKVGKPARLRIECAGHSSECFGASVKKAEHPQSKAIYRERLAKLGDSPLILSDCVISMDEDCYISAAELNALRRDAANALLEQFHVRNEFPAGSAVKALLCRDTNAANSTNKNTELGIAKKRAITIVYARVTSLRAARLAFDAGADMTAVIPAVFGKEFWNESELSSLNGYRASGKKLLLALPNVIITKKQHDSVVELIESGAFDGIEANNIGQNPLAPHLPIHVAGVGMNAINTYSIAELFKAGYQFVIPSLELTLPQLREAANKCGDGLLIPIHGRAPLMQLVHCPVKEHIGCRNCMGSAGFITDEAGRKFPLVNTRFPDKCLLRMLNCRTTDLIDIIHTLPTAAGFALGFEGETEAMQTERLSTLAAAMRGEAVPRLEGATRGHLNRRVE